MNAYNQAVKLWNANKKTIIADHVFAMPKKGTVEHGQVMAIARKIIEGAISDEIVKEIIRTHKTPYVAPKKERKPRTKKEKAVAALEVAAEAAPTAAAVAPAPMEKKKRKPRAKKEAPAPAPEPVKEPEPAPEPAPVEKKKRRSKKNPEPEPEPKEDTMEELEKAVKYVRDLPIKVYRRFDNNKEEEVLEMYRRIADAVIDKSKSRLPTEIREKLAKLTKGIKMPRLIEDDIMKSVNSFAIPTELKTERTAVKKRKQLEKMIEKQGAEVETKAVAGVLPRASEIADVLKAPIKSAVKTVMRNINLPALRDK